MLSGVAKIFGARDEYPQWPPLGEIMGLKIEINI